MRDSTVLVITIIGALLAAWALESLWYAWKGGPDDEN